MFDGLGSSRTTTISSQTVTATATYEGFGNSLATTGSTGSAYGFAATSRYRADGDAGLTHVGARYYDAQVGRFVTRDTMLSQHPYLYCEHDPVNCVDPSGHWPDWGNIGRGIIGVVSGRVIGIAIGIIIAPALIVVGIVGTPALIVGGIIGGAIGGYIGGWIGGYDPVKGATGGGLTGWIPPLIPGVLEEAVEGIISAF